MMSSCALAHIQSHASCAVVGPEGVCLEGVPYVPWNPPLKDKLVLKNVYFIRHSQTLNANAEKHACL